MRLGVVSDSHGHLENTRGAVRMLESLEVDQVLHCGDIGGAEIVELFAPWETHFVAGNCDYELPALQAAVQRAGQHWHGEFGELLREGRRIALLHSHDRPRFRQTIESGDWDLVCYGHSHQVAIDWHEQTLVLNPGALYRANPHSLAIVELPSLKAWTIPL